jgi:hypothetical protein
MNRNNNLRNSSLIEPGTSQYKIKEEELHLKLNNSTKYKSNNQSDQINPKSITSNVNFFNSNFLICDGVKSLRNDAR